MSQGNGNVDREREKKDLRDLNVRLANYIKIVQFLKAQNKNLELQLDKLTSTSSEKTIRTKQMFEAEVTKLSKDKTDLEIKSSRMQEQFGDVQRQLDDAKKYHGEQIKKMNQQVVDSDSEINKLRRTIKSLETDRARDKTTVNRLQQEVDKLRIDRNDERDSHLIAETSRQTLEEKMKFMKKVHEQELKENVDLAYRNTTAENFEFWKSELEQAIRDIQQENDAKVDQERGYMEISYNLKIQEYITCVTNQNIEVTRVREENKKMKKQMSDLRVNLADLEATNAQLTKQYHDSSIEFKSRETEIKQLKVENNKMKGSLTELQSIRDANLSLEHEIATYRTLLEGEDGGGGGRGGGGGGGGGGGEDRDDLKKVVEPVVNTQRHGGEMQSDFVTGNESRGDSKVSMQMAREEVAKTTYKKTSSGPIAICEVNPEGKFITLENTSSGPNKKDVNLHGWRLNRVVDGKRHYTYNFRNFTLKAGKKVKIMAQGSAGEASSDDLVFQAENDWGMGKQVTTTLCNEKEDEKARHIQTYN